MTESCQPRLIYFSEVKLVLDATATAFAEALRLALIFTFLLLYHVVHDEHHGQVT